MPDTKSNIAMHAKKQESMIYRMRKNTSTEISNIKIIRPEC